MLRHRAPPCRLPSRRLQYGILPASTSTGFSVATANGIDLRRPFGRRERVLRVSAPSRVVPLEDEREASEGSGGPSASGIDEKEEAFDPGTPPLFGLAEIRAAIPKRCWPG